MYHTIEKLVYHYYGFLVSCVKQIDNIYILVASSQTFVLKRTHILDKNLMTLPHFIEVIPTKMNMCYFTYENDDYYLMPYIQMECRFVTKAIEALEKLHNDTLIIKEVSQEFFEYEIAILVDRLNCGFDFFDHLLDNYEKYHPAIFIVIEMYPEIMKFKTIAFRLLEEFQKIVSCKNTWRFSASFQKINLYDYSYDQNCFIGQNRVQMDAVGKDFITLSKSNIEYENVELFYLSHFSFEKEERLWILLQLLCIEPWDFNQDAYASVDMLFQLSRWFIKLNKIMNSLQID